MLVSELLSGDGVVRVGLLTPLRINAFRFSGEAAKDGIKMILIAAGGH